MTSQLKAAPYGTWSSPITADSITKNANTIADIVVDSATSTIYHLESRPSEAGRNVLVNTKAGKDVATGRDWNVRTGVHEYGGAPAIVHNGITYFSHYTDGKIYRLKEGDSTPEAVTPESKARYANFDIHPIHTQLLVTVLEDHTIEHHSGVITIICLVNTRTKIVQPLVTGADFYSAPKFSPDGTRLAWQQWYHPDMPWEGAEIHVADVVVSTDGASINNDIRVAGERQTISAAFPSWASNSTLIFTSDESGYINPWKYTNAKASPLFSEPIAEDFGDPQWVFNIFPYAVLDAEGKYAVFSVSKDGRNSLCIVDLEGGSEPHRIDSPYVVIGNLCTVSRQLQEVAFSAERIDEGTSIVKCTISSVSGSHTATFTVLKSAEETLFSKGIISIPRPLTIKAPGGEGPLHLVYYAPTNPEYSGSNIQGERPPCVLGVHGGPTDYTGQGLNWKTQYFTSRGWAWLDVNYGGSSGYGRAYIKRLEGNWGVVDVEDCIHASKVISNAPYDLVDPKRVVIRGRSAGGYTVLQALTGGPDMRAFAAGAASFGISDMKPLVEHTHKFESRYLEKLLGGSFEEIPEIYRERSPINHVDKIVAPLLLLQGEIDKVVVKEQSETIYESVKARGGVVEYKMYEGEGHGWRQEKNIRDALEREIGFYERIFGFKKHSVL